MRALLDRIIRRAALWRDKRWARTFGSWLGVEFAVHGMKVPECGGLDSGQAVVVIDRFHPLLTSPGFRVVATRGHVTLQIEVIHVEGTTGEQVVAGISSFGLRTTLDEMRTWAESIMYRVASSAEKALRHELAARRIELVGGDVDATNSDESGYYATLITKRPKREVGLLVAESYVELNEWVDDDFIREVRGPGNVKISPPALADWIASTLPSLAQVLARDSRLPPRPVDCMGSRQGCSNSHVAASPPVPRSGSQAARADASAADLHTHAQRRGFILDGAVLTPLDRQDLETLSWWFAHYAMESWGRLPWSHQFFAIVRDVLAKLLARRSKNQADPPQVVWDNTMVRRMDPDERLLLVGVISSKAEALARSGRSAASEFLRALLRALGPHPQS